MAPLPPGIMGSSGFQNIWSMPCGMKTILPEQLHVAAAAFGGGEHGRCNGALAARHNGVLGLPEHLVHAMRHENHFAGTTPCSGGGLRRRRARTLQWRPCRPA